MILLPIFDGEVPDMDDRLAQFADDATATLAADPELRLEARAGLLAQLKERSEAFRAAGHEEDESNGLALDAFGDPKELAGKLRAANKWRRWQRAFVQVLLRWVLVPAILLMALVMCYSLLLQVQDCSTDDLSIFTQLPALPHVLISQSPDDRFAAQTQSPIFQPVSKDVFWLANPNRIIHLGYFINSLSKLDSSGMSIISTAEKLDPDNANYNYRIASLLLEKSLKIEYHRKVDPITNTDYSFTITDRLLFDRSMQEIVKGMAKPCLRRYGQDIQRERMGMLPEPKTAEDYYIRLKVLNGIGNDAESNPARIPLFEGCLIYSRMLLAQGHNNDASRYALACQRITEQSIGDSNSFNQLLEAQRNYSIHSKEIEAIYEQLGHPQHAKHTHESVAKINALFKLNNGKRNTISLNSLASHIEKIGGYSLESYHLFELAFINPAKITRDTLAPYRQFKQTLFEKFWLCLFLLLLCGSLPICWLAGVLRFRALRLRRGSSFQLLSMWKWLPRILAIGVLPIALYFIYTRYSGIAGRDYSVDHSWPRFSLECLLTIMAVMLLLNWQTGLCVRRRCRALLIPTPGGKEILRHTFAAWARWLRYFCWYAGLLLAISPDDMPPMIIPAIIAGAFAVATLIVIAIVTWRKKWARRWAQVTVRRLTMLTCFFAIIFISASAGEQIIRNEDPWQMLSYAISFGVLLLIAAIYPIYHHIRQLLQPRQFTLYYTLAARATLLTGAMALLLFMLTLAPYLSHYQLACIRRDRVVFPSHGELTAPAVEAQIVPELRQKMLRILNER